ncbi:MAG: GIN domain-containing protein [Brevinematia bacterium]
MKNLYILILLIFLSNCILFNQEVVGSGNTIEKNFVLNDYDSISLEGGYKLTPTETIPSGEIKIETDDNLFNYLEISKSGTKIKIKYKDGYQLKPSRHIYIKVAKNISNIENSGSLSLYETNISRNYYKISSSGSLSLDLSGSCNKFEIDSSGSLNFYGKNLTNTTLNVNVSGTVDMTVRVISLFKINVSGSGYIEYYGNPTICDSFCGSVLIEKAGN